MAQEFQVNGNKSPTDVSENSVKHEASNVLKAYLPPVLLGLQGLLLWLYLNSFVMDERAVALAFILFATHLLESTGILSPEDWINQPWRAEFFSSHLGMAFLMVGAASSIGFFIVRNFLSMRLILSFVLCGGLFFSYWVLRWRTSPIFKPFLVSLAWVLLLWGFTSADFSVEWPLLISLFLLLVLDSLWLDFRDAPGDLGPSKSHFLFSSRNLLHLGTAGILVVLFGWSKPELHLANIFILAVGALSFRRTSRWMFGMLISLWPLALLACV